MKRVIEVEDTLNDRVDDAIDAVVDELNRFLEENPDTEVVPDLFNTLDYDGSIHEIVDSEVPIYTSEIEDTWYLYSNELEKAYENAGVGNDSRENNGMSAIYFYIMEKVSQWYYENAEDIFEEWRETNGND